MAEERVHRRNVAILADDAFGHSFAYSRIVIARPRDTNNEADNGCNDSLLR